MPLITVFFGLILCGLSLFVVFVRAGSLSNVFANLSQSFAPGTWLIPAGFGIVLILLGLLAKAKPSTRMHAMHVAVLIGTIGAALCLFQGVGQLRKLLADQEVNMLAVGMVWSMAVVCLTYVFVCIQSFIAARKARQAAAGKESSN